MQHWYRKSTMLRSLRHANSDRQMRSEARETCAALGSLLLMYTDVLSLRVRVPKGPDLDYEWCARELGISYRRVLRASVNLQKAGLLKVRRKYGTDETTGERFALTAIKSVNKRWFYALGLRTAFERQKTKATNEKEKEARAAERDAMGRPLTDRDHADLANTSLFTDTIRRRIGSNRTSKRLPEAAPANRTATDPDYGIPLPRAGEASEEYFERILNDYPDVSRSVISRAYVHGPP